MGSCAGRRFVVGATRRPNKTSLPPTIGSGAHTLRCVLVSAASAACSQTRNSAISGTTEKEAGAGGGPERRLVGCRAASAPLQCRPAPFRRVNDALTPFWTQTPFPPLRGCRFSRPLRRAHCRPPPSRRVSYTLPPCCRHSASLPFGWSSRGCRRDCATILIRNAAQGGESAIYTRRELLKLANDLVCSGQFRILQKIGMSYIQLCRW
jgi:hypothetical protein